MKKKRLLSLLLCVCMFAGLLLPSAAAASPVSQSQVAVEENGTGARVDNTFESGWNKVATSGGTITLKQHITASNGSFGRGAGFTDSGAIRVPAGKTITVEMNGATINRGLSSARTDGCVFVVYGTLILKNSKTGVATITGGADSTYGGVYVGSNGSLTVSGAISITGNKSANDKATNVYLTNGKSITSNGLGNGSNIGVTTASTPAAGQSITIATGSVTAADAQRFKSDANHTVALANNAVVLKGPEPPQPTTSNSQPAQNSSGGDQPGLMDTPSTISNQQNTSQARALDASYTVTLDPQGGAVSPTTKTYEVGATTYTDLPTPTKTGYTFDGWSKSALGGDKVENTTPLDIAVTTLYAQWKANSYTVTFDLNGGNKPETDPPEETIADSADSTETKSVWDILGTDKKVTIRFEQTYGSAFDTVTESEKWPKPVKSDSEFLGWYINGTVNAKTGVTSGKLVKSDTTMNTPNNHTLYALWKDSGSIQITFKSGDEDNTEEYISVVSPNEEFTLPTVTTCGFTVPEGMIFDSWQVEGDTDKKFDAGAEVSFTADTTITAVWADAEHAVTLDPKGGTWPSTDPDDVGNTDLTATKTVTVNHKALVSTLPKPSKDGYDFAGWKKSPVATDDEVLADDTTIIEDMSLVAEWAIKKYTVTFDFNDDGETVSKTHEYEHNVTYGSYSANGLPKPEREGYDFAGWYTASSGGEKMEDSNTVKAENHTIYAHWTGKTYKITFAPNGGALAEDVENPQDVTYGEEYGTLPTPTWEGHTFSGWYIENGTDSTEIKAGSIVNTAGDHILTAHWDEVKYTVTYKLNGGESDTDFSNQTVTIDAGKTFKLPSTKPKKLGHEFAGWKVDGAEDSDKLLQAEEPYEITANVTFVAQWTANEYTVTLDPKDGHFVNANGETETGTKTITVTYGAGYGTLPTPVWDADHTFDGWYTAEDESTKVEAGTEVAIADDHTLYAHWRNTSAPIKYKVTYLLNGGVGTSPTQADTEAEGTFTIASGNGLTKEGFVFTGWKDDNNGTVHQAGATYTMPAKDVTFTAQWEPVEATKYSVTFDLDGGTPNGTYSQADTAAGETFDLPANAPTKIGHEFLGWDDGENIYAAGEEYTMPAHPVTFTAQWNLTAEAEYWVNGTLTDAGTFAAMWQKAADNNGTVKLLQNVTAVDGDFGTTSKGRLYIYHNETITLDLNGYTLDRNAKGFNQSAGQVIYNAGTLTIDDTSASGAGKITGGYSVASGDAVAGNGGGIENIGRLTLKGGSITGNYTEGHGGGVANIGAGVFIMEGGSITDNTAVKEGGGVYQDPDQSDSTNHGSFTMNGGTITENTAASGGGIRGAVTVSDSPKIFGNSDTEGDSSDVRGEVKVNNLGADAWIGVGTDASAVNGTMVVTGATAADVKKFFSNNEGFIVDEDSEDPDELILTRAATVEITLDANGGQVNGAETAKYTVTVGNIYGYDMPAATRSDYTFDGWYTAATGGEKIEPGDRVAAAEADVLTVLYAHWKEGSGDTPPEPEKTVTVSFNANGGSLSSGSITVPAGGKYPALPTPTRSNSGNYRYDFTGWYTAATGGTLVKEGDALVSDSDHTLYAHWDPVRISSGGTNRPSGSGSSSGSSSSKDIYLTASAGTGGSINPNGQSKVSRGSSKTYTITPNAGYAISDVLVDGKSVGKVKSYTFTNIITSHTIRAAFTPTTTQPPTTTTTATPSRSSVAYNLCTKDVNCPIAAYSDAQANAWYHDGVHYCINNRLMTGTSATAFEPNTPLSRAMLAQILYNREGSPSVGSGSSGFSDVASGAWCENAIKRAAATGLMVGYENGTYGPNDAITREQLAVVLWRHAGSPIPAVSTVPFDDYRNTREFARDAVRWAYGRGIINGKENGTLDPGGRASRAEVAQMLKNYLTT